MKYAGVDIRKDDPNYHKTIIDYVQNLYVSKFGKKRDGLNYCRAKAVLGVHFQGYEITHPDTRNEKSANRTKKRRNKSKTTIQSKPNNPPKLSIVKASYACSDEFLLSYEWRKLRYAALKKNNGKCELCGNGRGDGVKLHVDHIKPRRKYPELALSLENLQVLCELCNHGKGNWDETDWR